VTETLSAALAAFQADLPQVLKTQTATVQTKAGGSFGYSYADLAQVSAAVLPKLGALGLSWTTLPTMSAENRFVLSYRLMHTSGESLAGEYPLPQTGTSQEIGSAITYARRYALCSVVGVAADKDDDGAAGGKTSVDEWHQSKPAAWDPIEQDVLVTGWRAEIEDAKSVDELKAIGVKLMAAKKSRELSPASYDHLAKAGAAKRGELNGANQS